MPATCRRRPWRAWPMETSATLQRRPGALRRAPLRLSFWPGPDRSPTPRHRPLRGIRSLAFQDPRFQPLRAYYTICVKELHSDCFYDGHCEPVEEVAATIDQSAGFVADAERLAAEAEESR